MKKLTKIIYLDNAASTPLDDEVLKAMAPYWQEQYANPSALHSKGVTSRKAVDEARESVASACGANSDEVLFTSGGTESNNLAILGLVSQLEKNGVNLSQMHFVASAIEHPSVREVFKELERRGAQLTFVGVKDGVLDLDEFKKALQPNTVMVSVMYANNEIGTVQPITEIAKVVRKHRKINPESVIVFHTDASQAPLYLDIKVNTLGVDMMTLGGHKIYGPKGVGLLYIKKGVPITPVVFGGSHENGLRPGTENLPLIVGLSTALAKAVAERESESQRIGELRDFFINGVLGEIPSAEINGSRTMRLSNNANFCFKGVDAEHLLLRLDAFGILASTRSACKTRDDGGSHVIAALGKDKESIINSVRFALGKHTTKEDLEYVVKMLENITKK